MTRGFVLGCAWLGLIPTLVVFFTLGYKRRAWIPPLGWWLSIAIGAVMFFYGMSHSTSPSFANRATVVGKIFEYAQKGGRETHFAFRLVPDNGQAIDMESHISIPHWGKPAVLAQRTFRVTYLQDGDLSLKNEAVAIEIVSGPDVGFHDALDARPAGKWIFVPIGSIFFCFGFFGLKYMKEDTEAAITDNDEC